AARAGASTPPHAADGIASPVRSCRPSPCGRCTSTAPTRARAAAATRSWRACLSALRGDVRLQGVPQLAVPGVEAERPDPGAEQAVAVDQVVLRRQRLGRLEVHLPPGAEVGSAGVVLRG